jgi:adenine-specific DNA-methyltransferase
MSLENDRQEKLNQAKFLLRALGLPPQQQNDRSAWVLLALAEIRPDGAWSDANSNLHPTYKLMQFISEQYGKDYAANSRETIRRQTLHQFEQAQIIERNRDDPARATNSKDNNYALKAPILDIMSAYPDGDWEQALQRFKNRVPELAAQYERKLDMHKIPLKFPDGQEFKLSPGKHNQLHADIIHEFCPRFVKHGTVLYVGDTASSRKEGGKLLYLDKDRLIGLGVPPMSHEKLPDVVVLDEENQWLFLIEAVTSHGPVSPKRWYELEEAFKGCSAGIVYVTAFPDRAEFRKNAADIAWETEVWIADNPDHMVHFNGDRFLGPYQ